MLPHSTDGDPLSQVRFPVFPLAGFSGSCHHHRNGFSTSPHVNVHASPGLFLLYGPPDQYMALGGFFKESSLAVSLPKVNPLLLYAQ